MVDIVSCFTEHPLPLQAGGVYSKFVSALDTAPTVTMVHATAIAFFISLDSQKLFLYVIGLVNRSMSRNSILWTILGLIRIHTNLSLPRVRENGQYRPCSQR